MVLCKSIEEDPEHTYEDIISFQMINTQEVKFNKIDNIYFYSYFFFNDKINS